MLPIVGTTKTQRGFTLIELTLSIGLLGIILLPVFSIYGNGHKTYKRLQDQLYLQQNARQAILWLSTSIKQARCVDIISKSEICITTGNRETINFYLDKGVLYRGKNNGINPIAELKSLEFMQSADNTITVFISVEMEDDFLEIKTQAMPFGVWFETQ